MPVKLSHLPRSVAAGLAPQKAERQRQIAPTERSGVMSVPLPPLVTLGYNARIARSIFNNPRHLEAAKEASPVVHDRLVDVLWSLTALQVALEGVSE